MKFKIDKKLLSEENESFIVAEVGVNHNRDLKLAKKLVIEAANAGADAVKFQTWKTENVIIRNTDMAEYQKKNLGIDKSQYEMGKSLELPYEWHYDLKELAEDYGLTFFSTMEDKESVDFLINELKIPLIKVGSGDLTNYPLLKYTAGFDIPIILSTGMATLSEIDEAVRIIYKEGNHELILLHCTTQYPCPIEEVNLSAMVSLRACFKTLTGFSDHTLGTEVSVAAVALGASCIEKHFTLDKSLPGPDHKASVEPVEFSKMVNEIRNVEKAMGDGFKSPQPSELKNREIVVRRIVASKNIEEGSVLNDENISFKRANHGLEAKYYNLICGRKIKNDIKKDDIIKWEHL
jgi:N-acetylneuraminate synthase